MVEIEVVGPQNHFRTDSTSLWSIWNEFGRFQFLLQKKFSSKRMLCKQFLSIFEEFSWCEFENSIFSKSYGNIKNLSWEILDTDSLKLQRKGFDYSCNYWGLQHSEFQAQKVVWPAPKQLQTVSSAKEWYLWPISTFWKSFWKCIWVSYMVKIEVVGPQNHFRTDSTSLWSIWNEFGRFEFLLQKIFFSEFRMLCKIQLMWIRKIQFFQKV